MKKFYAELVNVALTIILETSALRYAENVDNVVTMVCIAILVGLLGSIVGWMIAKDDLSELFTEPAFIAITMLALHFYAENAVSEIAITIIVEIVHISVSCMISADGNKATLLLGELFTMIAFVVLTVWAVHFSNGTWITEAELTAIIEIAHVCFSYLINLLIKGD